MDEEKEAYLKHLSKQILLLCKSKDALARYDTKAECEASATKSFEVCVAERKDDMPEDLQSAEHQAWAYRLGTCTANGMKANDQR